MHTPVASHLYEAFCIRKYVYVMVQKVKSLSPTWENPQRLIEDST